MAFDREGFIQAATEAGFTKEQIANHLATAEKSSANEAAVDNFANEATAETKQASHNAQNTSVDIGGHHFDIPTWLTGTPAAIAATGLGTLAARQAVPKILDMLKGAPQDIQETVPVVTQTPEINPGVNYDIPAVQRKVINTPADLAADQTGVKTPSQFKAEYDAFKAAQQPPAVAPVQPPVQQAPTYNVPTGMPSVGSQIPSNMGVSPQESVIPPITEPTPSVPSEPAQPKTQIEYPTRKSFKSASEIPEGFVFRPDVGNVDVFIYNAMGPEHRQLAKELLNEGKMFGGAHGSTQAVNDRVKQITQDYWQALQSQIPENLLSREARQAQGIPSDFGTFANKGGFGKTVKVAGVAGTLFALADLANAKNAQEGVVKAADIATDLNPITALAKLGMAPSSLNKPELEWLAKRQYSEQVGSGRGLAYDPRRLDKKLSEEEKKKLGFVGVAPY